MSKRFSVVGQSLPKIDAWAKVVGETRYADDMILPRMAYGKLLRSRHAHALIKGILDVPVLYGGSVKPDNAEELLRQPDVDGALVGGASLELDSFISICRSGATS